MATMFVATGCADPIEGEWTSKDEVLCAGRVEHTTVIIDGDGTGVGDVCDCTFTFTWTSLSDELYRFDIDFDGTCFAIDGTYDCRVKTNGELDCDSLGDYIQVD